MKKIKTIILHIRISAQIFFRFLVVFSIIHILTQFSVHGIIYLGKSANNGRTACSPKKGGDSYGICYIRRSFYLYYDALRSYHSYYRYPEI